MSAAELLSQSLGFACIKIPTESQDAASPIMAAEKETVRKQLIITKTLEQVLGMIIFTAEQD